MVKIQPGGNQPTKGCPYVLGSIFFGGREMVGMAVYIYIYTVYIPLLLG